VQVRRRRPICAFELNDESAGEEKTPHTNWIVMCVTQVEIALEDWKKGIRGKGRENVTRQNGVPPKGSYGKEGKGAEGGVY